jgi:hypothetical protein
VSNYTCLAITAMTSTPTYLKSSRAPSGLPWQKLKSRKNNGCQYCLLYETHNYHHQENDDDGPDFGFELTVGSGTPVPVVIEKTAIPGNRYPLIKLYAPIGMFLVSQKVYAG